MSDRFEVYRKKINDRISNKRYRELTTTNLFSNESCKYVFRGETRLLNFCSNDYLGFSLNPEIINAAKDYTQLYGTGSRSSRLVSGNLFCHQELELILSAFLGAENALVFNTGYQGNISIISALCDKNSVIYADKLAHNSLLQGCLLSGAKLHRFKHNDMNHLEQLLKKNEGNSQQLIVSESVFSMDGDIAPLDALCELAEKYNTLLLIDDAHAVGVLGEQGKGLAFGKKRIDFVTGTFGKSLGSLGGYVLCSKEMKHFFVNFAAGFIYTTGIQPGTAGAVLEGLKRLSYLDDEREKLVDLSNELRNGLHELGYDTCNSKSQIVPMLIGRDEDALLLADYLMKEGIYAAAIRPPTVPEGKARIRFSLTVHHELEDIEILLHAISRFKKNDKTSG